MSSKPISPIKRRRKDKIKVHYNTRKVGSFHKTINVYSNASNSLVKLQIKGKVLAKKDIHKTGPIKKKSITSIEK